MKKKILKVTLVAAFALIAGFNVYNAQQSDVMSDLALANGEYGTGGCIHCPEADSNCNC